MKTFFIIGLAVLSLQNSHAQLLKKKELVKKTIAERFVDGELAYPLSEETLKAWNDKFDAQNLKRDRFKSRIDYTSLFPIKKSQIYNIKGSRVYYGVAPKKYRYRIIADSKKNELTAHIKINFFVSKNYLKLHEKNPSVYASESDILERFRIMVSDAQDIWNEQAPTGLQFKFDYEEDPSKADYKVKISTTLGALYDKFFYHGFREDTLAHEIGHMLGLDDEYSLITSNVLPINELTKRDKHFEYTAYQDMRCHLESLMCLRSTLYPYHFEHVFGRIPKN